MRLRKSIILILTCILVAAFTLTGCEEITDGQVSQTEETQTEDAQAEETEAQDDGKSSAGEEINLRDIYGGGSNYLFTCNGEDFTAIYYYDNWCIYDSYKITSKRDMKKICQALIDEHPIHGADYESYRTVDDMVYEWKQHNLAHKLLPDDNAWKRTSGNVDFDPEDQGKSLEELYEDRTGEEFNFSDHKDDLKEYLKRMLE